MLIRRISRSIVPIVAAMLGEIVACGEPTAPPRIVGRVEALAPTFQTTTVGTAVAVVPAIRVYDQDGQPLSRIPVTFQVTAGNGSVTTANTYSADDGTATPGAWMMGTVVGTNSLTALASTFTLTFNADATVGPPARIEIASGNNQTGTIQTALAAPFVARVTDKYSNPVAGAAVIFDMISRDMPHASISVTTATSASDGTVRTLLTLGDSAGPHEVSVRGADWNIGVIPTFFDAWADWRYLNAATLTGRDSHRCAMGTDGQAYCWGGGTRGEVGDGTNRDRYIATAVSASVPLTSVSAGTEFSCGLTAAGAAYCWGRNDLGQLGDGSQTDRAAPVPVSSGIIFRTLSTGHQTACGITTVGDAYCWGYNGLGMLGGGVAGDGFVASPVPVAGGQRFSSIGVGLNHVCALAETGAVYCWGRSLYGETGAGDTLTRHDTPVLAAAAGHTFTTVAVSDFGACALDSSGAAYCWGGNGLGELGLPKTTTNSLVPTPTSGGSAFGKIFGLGAGYCGTTAAGAAQCWGQEPWPPSQYSTFWTPTTVPDFAGMGRVTGGTANLCILTATGGVTCRGQSDHGQAGDGIQPNHWLNTASKVRAP